MSKTETSISGGLSNRLPEIFGFLLSFTVAFALIIFYQDRLSAMIWNTQKMNPTISSSAAMTMVNSAEAVRPSVLPAAPAASTEIVKSKPETAPNKEEAKESEPDQRENDDKLDQETLLRKFRNGKKVKMTATAYCINNITASGVKSKYGIVAADPKLLPIGSIVQIEADQYSGLYTVLDTGELIKGRTIDIYLTSYNEARNFGRRKIRLSVLRYGWNPQASAPAF